MNKKGFMMAELVVVSSIIVISLTGLYMSYNKLITSYRQIINYYDVGLMYKLGYYNKVLFNEKILDEVLDDVAANDYIYLNEAELVKEKLTFASLENIYIIKEASVLEDLASVVRNQTFKDYITYLTKSEKLDSTYFIIGEQCQTNNKKCKYAYMEVANG